MKILYLINHAGKAGTEKYVREMAAYAQQQGAEVLFAYNEGGLLVEQMADLGIPCLQIKMCCLLDLKAARALAKICREHKVNIIHAQYARENYLALLAKKFGSGARVVFTSHFHIYNNFLWRIANKIVTPANDAIIAVCTSLKSLLIKNKMPAHKIRVIFNGVLPTPTPRPLPSEPFTFTTICRLSAEKGLMFLLASVKILADSGKNFKVIIAGDGEMLPKMKEYIAANKLEGFVELPGYSDPATILAQSHVYICSSENEATSFSVLEAMAQSLPVIVTNVGGLPDIVNPTTNCGILVEYNDVKALAQAMETLMANQSLYNELAKNALLAIETTFNLQKMASATYNVYKELMNDD